MKQIKGDTNRWRHIPCSWFGRINIVKMTIQPKTIYRFNAILYQITNSIFHRIRTKNFTICMETQKTPNSQSNLEKDKWSGGIRLHGFRLYYKATVIKTVWYWHKNRNRSMEQDRKSIVPRTYGHLIYDKGGKNIQWRKGSLFNKRCWENWRLHVKE